MLAGSAELEALHRAQVYELTKARGGEEAAIAASERAWKKLSRAGNSEQAFRQVQNAVLEGYENVGDDLLVPNWAMETIRDQGRIASPGPDNPLRGVIRDYDRLTNLFKAGAVSTPGFHSRNWFGILFNNMLARIDRGTYFSSGYTSAFMEFEKAVRGGVGRRFGRGQAPASIEEATERAIRKIKDPGDQAAFRMLVEDGHLTGAGLGQYAAETVGATVGNRSNNPFNSRFRFYQANRTMGTMIEAWGRGALAFDRIRTAQKAAKTADPGEAAIVLEAGRAQGRSDVVKFHFDYEDLSALERGVFRRIVPFYTWTRKNFPLQLEMMLANPAGFQRFNHLKRNIEQGEEEKPLLLDYVEDQLHIRLPFSRDNGEVPMYVTPELPFKELTRTLDPQQILASSNPILRSPFEVIVNRRFFTGSDVDFGAQRLPIGMDQVVNNIPPLREALLRAGVAQELPDGSVGMSSGKQWVLSQNIPIWSQLDRLLPTNEFREDAVWDARVNYMTGLGVFSNTQRRQSRAAREDRENAAS